MRKALIVAKKLNLNDFENWIRNEMDGYPAKSVIPNYREVYGVCKYFNPYHGWQDVIFHIEPLILIITIHQ
ncbi:hypothetical protein [Pectinatus frisingensis]|uniref:AbiTii domain-containing protein n=1 Tax=Pectinatus frisingensis TaxID=865 RepID=UPI0018C68B5A|nr:hypothetical protein [Pectinatus frisingensis]